MNILKPDKVLHVYRMLSFGHGVRETARITGVNRGTVLRYRRAWEAVLPQLQDAYNFLMDGECERYDALIATLPDLPVRAMADAWLDDVDGRNDGPKSNFYVHL